MSREELTLGAFLWRARGVVGMSRRELAMRCGVSRQSIFCIEMGDFIPSVELCLQLARHLAVDCDVVLLLAGHVPSDILVLLRRNPQRGCALLRGELLAEAAEKPVK